METLIAGDDNEEVLCPICNKIHHTEGQANIWVHLVAIHPDSWQARLIEEARQGGEGNGK